MRFLADGPNIPDRLLEKRDEGKVVFLCGAGVSQPAGMPSFITLTEKVIDTLRPSRSSEIVAAFSPWLEGRGGPKAPLDQIFQLLHAEFGLEQVNRVVSKVLSLKGKKYDYGKHSVVARISSDALGRPQIVTTNFDRLFEKVESIRGREIHTPPSFPEIKHGVPISGITYLHGRVSDSFEGNQDYVLSSGDLWRAYLSEAWATEFIRSSLKQYTVVLLGYKAEDPPIKYLLQGLNSTLSLSDYEIYAFDHGDPGEVEARWRDRGVRSIPFRDFDSLWANLEEWAVRADNPEKWKKNLVELSRQGPRFVSPHERGMVVHLVRSLRGAQLFSEAKPSITAEWLCVFDRAIRIAKPEKDYHNDNSVFDPQEAYGLDDDIIAEDNSPNSIGDILKWRSGDEHPPFVDGLVAEHRRGRRPLSPRVSILGDWIVSSMGDPIVAWWVGKKGSLDDGLARKLERGIERVALPDESKRRWRNLLEAVSDVRNTDNHDYVWYDCVRRLKSENWSNSALRFLECATRPRFSVEHSFGVGRVRPPHQNFEGTVDVGGTYLKVRFPSISDRKPQVPEDKLVRVFQMLQAQLFRATEMLEDLDDEWFRFPTCYPKRDQKGETYVENREGFFYWFLSVLNETARVDPDCVKGSVKLWINENQRYFLSLRLYALNIEYLYSSSEILHEILSADFAMLMERSNRREFLFLLEDQWGRFSVEERVEFTRFCLAGCVLETDDSEQVCPLDGIRCLAWLKSKSRLFPKDVEADIEKAIASVRKITAEEIESLTLESGVISRAVTVDESPGELIEAPIHSVLEIAGRETGRYSWDDDNREPFIGLVKSNYKKALLAVICDAKRGNYSPYYWRILISNWPNEHSSRLLYVFTQNLLKFPQEFVVELSYSVGGWFTDHFPDFYLEDSVASLAVFDHFVACCDRRKNVDVQQKKGADKDDSENEINSIISQIEKAAEGVLLLCGRLELKKESRIPDTLADRLRFLLGVRREFNGGVISYLARKLDYLFHVDPHFAIRDILPLFGNTETERHAWKGLFTARYFPQDRIWIHLKARFIELFPRVCEWGLEKHSCTNAHRFVVFGVTGKGKTKMTTDEASDCIRAMTEEGRSDIIRCLSERKKSSEWGSVVLLFVRKIWPKELKYRTTLSTHAWISLLSNTGDRFPKFFREIRGFLVPSDLRNATLYDFTREVRDESSISSRFPAEALDLFACVTSENPHEVPYEMESILSEIRDASPVLETDDRYLKLTELVNRSRV